MIAMGGNMKLSTTLLVTAALSAGAAQAGPVAPGDVQHGEYGEVAESLTGASGDPENGALVFMNRKLGNCLACHANSDMSEQPFHGEVGPPLDGAADRWEEADLRGILVNAKSVFPGTIMPAFYVDDGFTRNRKSFQGKTILDAQQVEDVLAYLMTLSEE
jgi:sulfur-oxidizing protein SoxX